MGEKQVSVDGKSLALDPPFVVVATQNPIDSHGTYPLPEAQLDRFSMQLSLGYPTSAELKAVMFGEGGTAKLDHISPVLDLAEVLELQAQAASVRVEDSVADYLLEIVERTRAHGAVRFGVSPRGALAFAACAKAWALMSGRDFVVPEDVKKTAVPVLAHRIVLDMKSKYSGIKKEAVVSEILETVRVPR